MGGGEFEEAVKARLMSKARGRKIIKGTMGSPGVDHGFRAFFRGKKGLLSPENACYLDE